jgi:hypothetical protein
MLDQGFLEKERFFRSEERVPASSLLILCALRGKQRIHVCMLEEINMMYNIEVLINFY